MNKCTLLIDGNWLLISRFSVMLDLFNASNSKTELDSAKEKLKDMMARSINIALNRLPMVDNIIFVADGGSWRKKLPIPKQLDDITYKGNREKDKTVDISWNHVFDALNEFVNNLSDLGITTCRQLNIEGDDWVWYWSRKLNDQGTNCIIWSADHDLMQLVQNKGEVFTAWMYDRKGKTEIVFHKNLELHNPGPDELDFFMQPMVYRPNLVEELEKKSTTSTYIDPNTIINNKIICGDVGDNIKSVVRVQKNNRTYGVGQKDWAKIASKLDIVSIYDLIDHIDEVSEEISNIKKFANLVSIQDIKEMIEYNINLVWLNEQIIPEPIVAVMNQHDYNQYDLSYIRGSYTTLLGENDDIKDIFESI